MNTPSTYPRDHLTVARCRPDFLASLSKDNINWSEVEATVEIHSAGRSEAQSIDQAATYTFYLLQARPDRISVQGMWAGKTNMILIIASAAGIKTSPKLDISNSSHVQLIHAFIKRLYDPHPSMIDPTIKRRKEKDSCVFDIAVHIESSGQLETVQCNGYRILTIGNSLHQRSHNSHSPARICGNEIPIIKDQYVKKANRFTEAEILEHIHKEDVPGVVHCVHSETVQWEQDREISSSERKKIRMCLVEYGRAFMDLETPLEALKAVYDLLESESNSELDASVDSIFNHFFLNSHPAFIPQAQCITSGY